MRARHIFGNWKMYTDRSVATMLARGILEGLPVSAGDAEVGPRVAVFPPSCWLTAVSEILHGSDVAVGVQHTHSAAEGAYTGEISAEMAKAAGASLALVGHSERRQMGLTDREAKDRVRACRRAGLLPVLCVGETEAERTAGKLTEVLTRQLAGALEDDAGWDLVLAYEPVWAIGTGRTARPEDAREAHGIIRGWMAKGLGNEVAAATPILYGGSVKPENAPELLRSPDVDGLLVGGSSLKVNAFLSIVKAAGE